MLVGVRNNFHRRCSGTDVNQLESQRFGDRRWIYESRLLGPCVSVASDQFEEFQIREFTHPSFLESFEYERRVRPPKTETI
jgi:hypothetical protein